MVQEITSLPFDTLPSPPYRPRAGMWLEGLGVAMIVLGLVLPEPIAVALKQPLGLDTDEFGFVAVLFVGALLSFVGLFAVGVLLVARGRQMRALPALELLRRDRRPPVLFLRSFDDDDLIDPTPRILPLGDWFPRRYEESLAKALRAVGPMITIGRPGEKLALLGAGRLLVPDHAWQAAVDYLGTSAVTVVLMVGRSQGIWWEINSSLRLLPMHRLLFFFPYVEEVTRRRSLWQRFIHYHPSSVSLNRKPYVRMEQERQARFALFRERIQPSLLQQLPQTLGTALFIDFQTDGRPRALTTVRPWWWPFFVLTPSARRMLANVERTLAPFVEKLQSS